jgi:hypothetical protein
LNPRVDQENAVAEYRLAPAVVLRSAGAAFVLLAVAVLALSVVTALAGWSFLVVGVVAGLGLLGVLGGAGVKRARWADVAQASTAEVGGQPCVVLALRDGRTTTVPVGVLAGDRDEFVTRVRALLRG